MRRCPRKGLVKLKGTLNESVRLQLGCRGGVTLSGSSPKGLGVSSVTITLSSLFQELYYQATESAEEGRRLAHKLGDQTLEGSALIVIARTHWADRDAQRAIGFAREAEALFREARDHQNTRVAVQLVQWFEKQSRGVKLSSGAEGSSAKPVATPARLDEVKVS